MRYCKGIFKLTLKYDDYSRVSESWLTGLVHPDTIFELAELANSNILESNDIPE